MEKELVALLKKNHLKISFAESCTGGLLANKLVSVSGASNVFEESYVTYSEKAKIKILHVDKKTIEKYTVYSKEVAIEMCKGLYECSKANICVSVTGKAGGDLVTTGEGSCDFAIYIKTNEIEILESYSYQTIGSRNEVRENFANYIFNITINLIKNLIK